MLSVTEYESTNSSLTLGLNIDPILMEIITADCEARGISEREWMLEAVNKVHVRMRENNCAEEFACSYAKETP